MNKKNLSICSLWVTGALCLSGCATTYQMSTNAYLDQSKTTQIISPQASFYVLPNPNVPNPLFDQEVRTKIETLLKNRGFKITDKDHADYWVRSSYDIGGRSVTLTRPEWVTTPSVTQRVYSSRRNSYHTVISQGYSYVTYVPETQTFYNARLFIKVLDAQHQDQGEVNSLVWLGDTVNDSQNPDLRESIDYLLVATFKYFDQDTAKNQNVVLNQSDPEVLALRASVVSARLLDSGASP